MFVENDKWEDIRSWIGKSQYLFVKKLAPNDHGWAKDTPTSHQNGVLIPRDLRNSAVFCPPTMPSGGNGGVLEFGIDGVWPSTGEICRSSLRDYSTKGEARLTRLPRYEFASLSSASLFIGGRLAHAENGATHWFMTIDALSEEAAALEDALDLDALFRFAVYEPDSLDLERKEDLRQLVQLLHMHAQGGTLPEFVADRARPLSSEAMASRAQDFYLLSDPRHTLDPYRLDRPGDVLMFLSRELEYHHYKKLELEHRAADVIRILNNHKRGPGLVGSVVYGFAELNATFLSASQRRKSRAGLSFEFHMQRFLSEGNIRFEAQAVTGGRRPDFVLPGSAALTEINIGGTNHALILSTKTTLRERWKQLGLEKKLNCPIFLATVDDRISSEAIDDMASHRITLVVPESLKESDALCYAEKSNVISFKEFFHTVIASQRPSLLRRS